VGRAGLFHSAAGVHCVRALVARAGGEPYAARMAEEAFMRASRARSDKWDLVLGRTGVLLGAAFLHEADPSPKPTIERFGNRAAQWLTRRLAAAGSPSSSKEISALGVAHGWAGGLYALLRWSVATRRPVDDTVVGWLNELASMGTRSGRGASWPRFRTQSDYSLQATWCNGDTGFVFLWLLASETLNDERFLIMAEDAGWNVADRGCERTADLCCGSAGRAYGLLALYRRTGDEVWLRRAKQFTDHAVRESDPDSEEAHRLYKGGLGVALLAAELEDPSSARMPLFEPEGWRWSRVG
jgi:serine/threonine-protein kinase